MRRHELRVRKVLLLGISGAGKSTLAHQLRQYCERRAATAVQFASQADADEAVIALCMALHPRLGAESPLNKLPIEILLRLRALVSPPPLPQLPSTSGIIQSRLRLPYAARSLDLLDVGGQRNQRRKWVHTFDQVDVVVFVVPASDFDQVLVEDGSTNRMAEALSLWEQIANHASFKESRFLLLLNKRDLLQSKLAKAGHMGAWDPSAVPLGANVGQCLKFVEERFLSKVCRSPRRCCTLAACASDTRFVDALIDCLDFRF